MITGITFDFQDVLSKNDGRLYQALFGSDYIINGCACTVANSGTAINVAEGYVAVGGRIIHFDGGETKKLTPTLTTGYGRLVVDIDLTKTAAATEFKQVTLIEQYSTTEKFQDLTQDNINLSGTHYQAELCRFTISSSAAGAITAQMPFFGGAVKKNSAEIQNLINLNGNGTRKLNVRWSGGGAGNSVYVYVTPNGGTEQQIINITADGSNKHISELRLANATAFTFADGLPIKSATTVGDLKIQFQYIFRIPGAIVIQMSIYHPSSDGIPDGGHICTIPSGCRPSKTFTATARLQKSAGGIVPNGYVQIKSDGQVTASKNCRYVEFIAIIPSTF